MPFMTPEYQKTKWMEIDGPMGTEFIPLDTWAKNQVQQILNECVAEQRDEGKIFSEWFKDYAENDMVYSLNVVEGYGCRLSASGYMDKTEWSVFETEKEAREYIENMYDVCSYCGHDFYENSHSCLNCGNPYLVP